MENQKIAENLNILGQFCGKRDVEELNQKNLHEKYGIEKVDVMVLFGGSILAGGDVLAKAIKDDIAEHYIIVGGEGHTTATLKEQIHKEYPLIAVNGLTEAELFQQYLLTVYQIQADYLETKSTNCGNNITNLLKLMKNKGIAHQSIILCQDATMQYRMEATLRKYLSKDTVVINYAAYQAYLNYQDKLIYATKIHGMWDVDRYINLLMGEIPRLTDNERGYGPNGKNFLAHVDIPNRVVAAFEALKPIYGNHIRKANPKYSSVL